MEIPSSELIVMTFNLRMMGADSGENSWTNREGRIHQTIHAADPDILGVQEAHLPQFESIKACLPDHIAVGVGRGDGIAGDEFAALFIRRSRFEVIESDTFWLSETPTVPGSMSWNTACTRICTWARIRDCYGHTFLVANTHWDHISVEAQEGGAHLIVDLINHRPSGDAAIVMGDLNSTDEDAPVQHLIACASLTSVLPNRIEGTYHDFTGTPTGRPIDHILVQGLAVNRATVDSRAFEGKYPSDHFPIVAHLRVG